MKKAALLIALLLLSSIVFSQEEDAVYKFKFGVELEECNALGRKNGKTSIVNKDTKFNVVQLTTNGDHIIHIIKYSKEKVSKKAGVVQVDRSEFFNSKLVYDDNKDKKFFIISKDTFDDKAEIALVNSAVSFVFGGITVPIKLRFGSDYDDGNRKRQFNFAGDVNIGMAAGIKFKPSKNRDLNINVLGGFSIASIGVDSEGTNGFVTSSTKVSSFTPSLSCVVEVKDFQIGLFTGADFLSGELGQNWDYQSKLWLGIGLGYGILNKDKKIASTDTDQEVPN